MSVLPTEGSNCSLYSPVSGMNYYSDQLIHFWALVSDGEDAAEDLIVTWSSNIDGQKPYLDTSVDSSGEVSDYTYLSEGQHLVRFVVRIPQGKHLRKRSSYVLVQRIHPVCGISEPLDNSSFVIGEAIKFRGTASDDDIPANEGLRWSEIRQGWYFRGFNAKYFSMFLLQRLL